MPFYILCNKKGEFLGKDEKFYNLIEYHKENAKENIEKLQLEELFSKSKSSDVIYCIQVKHNEFDGPKNIFKLKEWFYPENIDIIMDNIEILSYLRNNSLFDLLINICLKDSWYTPKLSKILFNKYKERIPEIIKKLPDFIRFIPKEYLTYEIYLEVVKSDGSLLTEIPQEMQTEELYIEAIGDYPHIYTKIPKEIKTDEFNMKAIKKNNRLIGFIPEEMITIEMCLEAVKSHSPILIDIPSKFRTEEICLEAIKWNGVNLRYVPHEIVTKEMCLEAVKQDGQYLNDVPHEIVTKEMCLEAVKQNDGSIYCVPEEFLEECLDIIYSSH